MVVATGRPRGYHDMWSNQVKKASHPLRARYSVARKLNLWGKEVPSVVLTILQLSCFKATQPHARAPSPRVEFVNYPAVTLNRRQSDCVRLPRESRKKK